jgi:putative Mn2+ efflux pump MntP
MNKKTIWVIVSSLLCSFTGLAAGVFVGYEILSFFKSQGSIILTKDVAFSYVVCPLVGWIAGLYVSDLIAERMDW